MERWNNIDRVTSSIHWFALHMPITARNEPKSLSWILGFLKQIAPIPLSLTKGILYLLSNYSIWLISLYFSLSYVSYCTPAMHKASGFSSNYPPTSLLFFPAFAPIFDRVKAYFQKRLQSILQYRSSLILPYLNEKIQCL